TSFQIPMRCQFAPRKLSVVYFDGHAVRLLPVDKAPAHNRHIVTDTRTSAARMAAGRLAAQGAVMNEGGRRPPLWRRPARTWRVDRAETTGRGRRRAEHPVRLGWA